MRVPDFLKSVEVLPTVALTPVPKEYFLEPWLPIREVPSDEVMFAQSIDENPMADFVAVDAEVPKTQNKITDEVRAQIGYIRVKHEFKESDIRWYQENYLYNSGQIGRYQAQERQEATEELFDMRQMIDARLEWLRVNALQGTITYTGNAGANFTLSYGVPSGNRIPAGTPWSQAGADVISDLNGAIDRMEEVAGFTPTELIISRKRMNQLVKNTGLQGLWRETFGQGGANAFELARNMPRQVISTHLNLNIHVHNARTTTRTMAPAATGAEPTVNNNLLLAEDKALLLPNEPVGSMLTSPGPSSLTDSAGLYTWDNTTETIPFLHTVGVGYNAMPVIDDENKLCILTI